MGQTLRESSCSVSSNPRSKENRMRTTKIVSNLTLVLLMTLLGSVVAFPQATDGNIIGTVLDPSGAVVAGTNIELENVATGVKLATTSNADGQYRFINIPVG